MNFHSLPPLESLPNFLPRLTDSSQNMDALKTIKKFSIILGLEQFNHPKSQQISTLLRGLSLLVHLSVSLSTGWYFLLDADTFIGQAKSCEVTNMSMYCSLNFCILLQRWDQIVQNMDNLMEIIHERWLLLHNFKFEFLGFLFNKLVFFLLNLQVIQS